MKLSHNDKCQVMINNFSTVHNERSLVLNFKLNYNKIIYQV